MNADFLKITAIYIGGIVFVFYLIWTLLGIALPDANLSLSTALAAAFNIELPDNMDVDTMEYTALGIILIVSFLSIGLIVINSFFGAIITERLIHPRVNIVTSSRGVLSDKWNPDRPFVLVRMSNFFKNELVDIKISVVLHVEEIRNNGIKGEQFISYLPVHDYTPPHILTLKRRMPWSIAVPADIVLNSSLTKNYHFKPGEPITKSFSPGKEIVSVKRTLEFLIQGVDTGSHASFAIYRKILVDEQDGEKYTLHLHKGSFKSLPLEIQSADDLEQYV